MAAHAFSGELIEARLIEDVDRKREEWKKATGADRLPAQQRLIAALELLTANPLRTD